MSCTENALSSHSLHIILEGSQEIAESVSNDLVRQIAIICLEIFCTVLLTVHKPESKVNPEQLLLFRTVCSRS